MGATWFQIRNSGKTLQDAYKSACEMAEEEYGHQDGYNGTISTTDGVRDVTQDYKNSKKSLEQYINSQADKLNKRDCCAICIQEPVGNKNKTKSQVEHIVTPGTKKWVLKYVVSGYDGEISSHDTKGAAVAAARTYTEKHLSSTVIHIEKRLEKSNAIVAKITYKKSTTERDGRWIFFGWAAE